VTNENIAEKCVAAQDAMPYGQFNRQYFLDRFGATTINQSQQVVFRGRWRGLVLISAFILFRRLAGMKTLSPVHYFKLAGR